MSRYSWILFFFLIISIPVSAEDEIDLPVPLYVDGVYSGEITLKINGRVLVQARPLFNRLAPLLDQKKLEETLHRWRQVEWTPYETLADSPISAEFDETNLIFLVEIPPESKRPGSYSLSRAEIKPPENLTETARLSGVLNMEGWSRIAYDPSSVSYEIGPELGVNFSDYVLEARGGIQSEGELFFADYGRVVKDFLPLSLRAEAGDLTYDAEGFGQERMVGFSLFRKTSLDMNYQVVPELGQTIFFPEPAEVEIRVNSRTVRKRSVPAGTWTFKNFPLNQGANEVEILWTDSTGEHREFFFKIYDSGLLKKYETDWGISAGTDSWTTLNPAFLGHVSLGVTHTFTAGVGSFYDLNDNLIALEIPLGFASPVGTFQFVPSADIVKDEGYGAGAVLNHSFSERRAGHFRQSFGSSLGFQWDMYSTETQTYSARGYYNYSPLKDLSFTPAVNWSYEAIQSLHTIDCSVRIRKSSGDGSTMSVQIGMVYDEEEWAPKATLTYSLSLPEYRQNFYARGDLSGENMNLSWNRYSDTKKQQDYNLSASAVIPSNREDRLTFSMSGGYIHPRFTANLAQGFNAFIEDEDYDNTTTLSAGTALVYADGVLGWSRPVKSEFVIIESQIGPLEVNPTAFGSMLDMDGHTPETISSLSPYRYTTLRLVPDQLPAGADINDYTTVVFPSYRSGTLIRVEEKIYMFAGGILTDENGKPLELILGEIAPFPDSGSEDDGTEKFEKDIWPREFFTDETGYFECYGLAPGKYLLTQQDRELTYIIEVNANESGYYNLGEVKPENQN